MKKIFAIILSILLCFGLFSILIACGEKDNKEDNNQIENNQPEDYNQNQDSGQTDNKPPEKILPTSITLSETNIKLFVGETHQLYATVSPLIDNAKITWSSLNSDVVTVDNKGTVTAISVGTSVIRAITENNLVASCTVNVELSLGNLEVNVTAKIGLHGSTLPDVNARIIVIPESLEKFPLDFNIYDNFKAYGIFTGKADSNGKRVFNNIPIGKYRVIVESEKADLPTRTFLSYLKDGEITQEGEEVFKLIFGDNLYNKLQELKKQTYNTSITQYKNLFYTLTFNQTYGYSVEINKDTTEVLTVDFWQITD